MASGRPSFKITDDVIRKTEKLAAQGLAEYQIAAVLGICHETLRVKKKEFSAFSAAITDGKAKGIATITNSLFEKAKSGDVVAQKYFLNNRDNENWKEKRDVNAVITHRFGEMSDSELDSELDGLIDGA